MLVSRQREQEILRNSLKEEQSSFIAIYGRRRVGKTFLVRETFGDAIFFSHTGIADGTLKLQLKAFYDSAVTAGCDAPKVPKDWIEAFSILKQSVMKSRRRKKVIFLDELSWMDTPRSHFLTALEFFWNGWASGRKDIVLIVCASATSWIMDNIVHNKGGLHNRLNDQIQLNPFTLKECEELARANGLKTDRQDILQYYMALGGIPYYWKLLERGASTAQNFDRLFFTENARLRDEYEYLYASLFKKPEPYVAIVSTLAKKKSGMTRLELITAAHLTNSGVTTKNSGSWSSAVLSAAAASMANRGRMPSISSSTASHCFISALWPTNPRIRISGCIPRARRRSIRGRDWHLNGSACSTVSRSAGSSGSRGC